MANFEKRIPKTARPATRNYLRETKTGRIGGILSGIGRAGSMLGKELTKPGSKPESSAAARRYAAWKGYVGGMPEQEVLKKFQRVTGLPAYKQKVMEVELEALARKNRSKFVTPKKLQAAQKRLEGLLGKTETAVILRSFDVDNPHGPMGRGLMTGKKAGEHIERLNLPEHTRKLAALYVGGLDQRSLPSGRHGALEEEFAQYMEGVRSQHGEHVAQKIEQQFGGAKAA